MWSTINATQWVQMDMKYWHDEFVNVIYGGKHLTIYHNQDVFQTLPWNDRVQTNSLIKIHRFKHLVLNMEYPRITRPSPCPVMPWFLSSPGQQQPRCLLCRFIWMILLLLRVLHVYNFLSKAVKTRWVIENPNNRLSIGRQLQWVAGAPRGINSCYDVISWSRE